MCRFSTLWLVITGLFAADDLAALQLGPLSVAAGPWMQVDDRGLITVSVRLLPPINQAALSLVQPYIGQARLTAQMASRVIPPAGGMLAGQIVANWTLPPLTSGRVRLGADARSPSVEVPILPGPGEAVAIAIVGGARWPNADLLGFSAGGAPTANIASKKSDRPPVSAVLLLGTAPLARIGTGGWESQVPIIARLAPPRAGDEVDAMQLAILGPPGVPGADLTWGCLGLPSMLRGPDVAVDLARRTRAWDILIDPLATWDVSLQAARDHHDVEGLRLGIGIARMLGIPCILAGGSPAGFISEPMITGKLGGMEVVTGGVRYVATTPAGDGVRSLDAHIAVTLDAPATAIIEADAEHLSWSLAEGPGELALRWSHDANLAESGPGRADCLAMTDAWRATQIKKSPAKEANPPGPSGKEAVVVASDPLLAWLPRRELVVGEWSLIELFVLAGSSSATDHLLARRLVADPWLVGDEEALLRRLPDWLQREALLRWMAEPGAPAHAWVRVAGTTKDTGIVRALLANVEHGGSPVILEVLVERLTAQAAGRIPLDDDPMLQSRLTAAVFDANTLSPTPLRAIARDLEPRLSPLGRKPVTRFLGRVGRFRPVP